MYHVIQVHAWTEEPALMNQKEATAVSARADSVVKYVKVRAIWLVIILFGKIFLLEKKHCYH